MLLAQTLSAVDAGEAAAVPQQGEVSLAPKLTLEDGRLDWNQPALAIGRRARGVTPEPGAWTTLDGQRVKLEPVRLRPDGPALQPGAAGPGRQERAGGNRLPPGGADADPAFGQENDGRGRLGARTGNT